MSRYADGTLSGYVDESEQERSDRAHFDAEHRRSMREKLIAGGFLRRPDHESREAMLNHRAMWCTA